jgi:hypothetical protein
MNALQNKIIDKVETKYEEILAKMKKDEMAKGSILGNMLKVKEIITKNKQTSQPA